MRAHVHADGADMRAGARMSTPPAWSSDINAGHHNCVKIDPNDRSGPAKRFVSAENIFDPILVQMIWAS